MKTILKLMIIALLVFLSACDEPENPNEIPLVWSYDELPAGAGDMMLVGEKLIAVGGGYLVALNKDTGKFIWQSNSIGSLFRNPILLDNYIYAMNKLPGIVKLKVEDGQVIDSKDFSNDYGCFNSELIANNDDKIYMPLYKLSPFTPLIAEIDISNNYELSELIVTPGRVTARLLVKDNILYIPYMNAGPSENPYAGLIAYDLGTHTEKWHTPFDEDGIYSHNPTIYGDKIYISVGDYMREVDLETGEEIRKFYGQGFDGSSVGDGVIFLAGWMRAYFLDTGEPVWEGGLANGDVASGSIFYKGSFYSFPRGLCRVEARTGKYLNDFTWERNENTEPVWKWDSTWWMPLLDESTNILYINGFRGVFAFKLPE